MTRKTLGRPPGVSLCFPRATVFPFFLSDPPNTEYVLYVVAECPHRRFYHGHCAVLLLFFLHPLCSSRGHHHHHHCYDYHYYYWLSESRERIRSIVGTAGIGSTTGGGAEKRKEKIIDCWVWFGCVNVMLWYHVGSQLDYYSFIHSFIHSFDSIFFCLYSVVIHLCHKSAIIQIKLNDRIVCIIYPSIHHKSEFSV